MHPTYWEGGRKGKGRERSSRSTLHHIVYTLHPTTYTLHSTPYTLHPRPQTLNHKTYTLDTRPEPLNSKPKTREKYHKGTNPQSAECPSCKCQKTSDSELWTRTPKLETRRPGKKEQRPPTPRALQPKPQTHSRSSPSSPPTLTTHTYNPKM